MRLFCAIGWHRAKPFDRWNRGYHFSQCSHCGRDLVRTAAGRWHVPKGYRVVWRSRLPVEEAHGRSREQVDASEHVQPSPAEAQPQQAEPNLVSESIILVGPETQARQTAAPTPVQAAFAPASDAIEKALDADLVEGTPQPLPSLAGSAVPPPAEHSDPSIGNDAIEQATSASIAMAEPQATQFCTQRAADPFDDFMDDREDADDDIALPAPKPVLLDLDRDFMDDFEDFTFEAAPAQRTRPLSTVSEDLADETAAETAKTKKSRRSRRKAADS